MCDSMQIYVDIKSDMPDEEYLECRFPWEPEGADGKRGEFYEFEMKSPLTGAGFLVKAVGVGGIRHTRIGDYWLSANIPACTAGHNRELVNGVYWGAGICFALLRYFLASRGCSEKGMSYVRWENVRIGPVTLTFLRECQDVATALSLLNDVRQHSEALLNNGIYSRLGKKRAFVVPDGASWPDDIFTLYVKEREFAFVFYVKQQGANGAFLKKIDVPGWEVEVQERSTRTLRIEVTAHVKWLRDAGLGHPDAWRGNPSAYEMMFNLIKDEFRIGEKWRISRIRRSTINSLSLPKSDRECLFLHVSGKEVDAHPVLRECKDETSRSKRFSAIRKRIFDEIGIDLRIPWKTQQAGIRLNLTALFEYSGEFLPPAHLREVVYSRVSAPIAYQRLETLATQLLSTGVVSTPLSNCASDDEEDGWPDPPPSVQDMFGPWADD